MTEQLHYIEDCTKARVIELVRRGEAGNAGLVYLELAEWNEAFAARVRSAADDAALSAVTADIRVNGYWRYNAEQNLFDWDAFALLTLDERKALLLDSLDANHLYVNYGDIADAAYGVSADDIAVNKAFYEGHP